MSAPLSVKLACRSWQQLSAIHSRDLSRSAFFLKTEKPPPLGTAVRISLRLPSGSTVQLVGAIDRWVAKGEMDGRGPGINVSLEGMSQSVMWLIESALSSAGLPPRPAPASVNSHHVDIPKTPAPALDLADGDEFAAAEGELVQALRQELRSMARMNAFQLLGVSADTTDEAVRSAFGELSKKYHPDRFARYESIEIREVASEVFILLRNAYQEASSEQGRRALAQKLERAGGTSQPRRTPPPPPARTPQPPPARTPPPPIPTPPPPTPSSQQKLALPLPPKLARTSGDDLPTLGRGPALAPPTDTSARKSSHPDLDVSARQNQVASNRVEMAMNVLDSGQYEQALTILKTEAHRDPNNITVLAGVELAQGRLALASGNRMEAAERFEAALDIDPSNERAAHEIADMRRHATSQRRGLLSKLMKRV